MKKLEIGILSDKNSWKNAYIPSLVKNLRKLNHKVYWTHSLSKVNFGDILILIGSTQIVPSQILRRNSTNIVIHESYLPKGRGWSPMSWQILEGKSIIPITVCEAVQKVDAGPIYLRSFIKLGGNELSEEWRKLAMIKINKMACQFVRHYPSILKSGQLQKGTPSYYPKRSKNDSKLDPHKSIASQFGILRIVDNLRYPAFLKLHGRTYKLKIECYDD